MSGQKRHARATGTLLGGSPASPQLQPGDPAGGRVVRTLGAVKARSPGGLAAGCLTAGCVAVGVFASACNGAASGNSAADQAFAAAVHVGAPDIGSFRSNTQLIRLGHAACDAFRGGASYQQIADRMSLLEGRNPLPSPDLGVVVTSAVDAYCPQYRSKV
jgi:hypothetical protein